MRAMKAIYFNQGWTYRHLEEQGPGTPVTLPHDAMLYEQRDENFAGGINTGWYDGRDYLYEKKFTPSQEEAGKCLILEFEGVYHNAEVLLNGEKLAFRPYGYTNFYVDVTGKVKADAENVLQVIARNSDQPNSRWYSGAGIYRPVTLWTGDEKHIALNGVRIRTLSVQPAQIAVTVRTSLPGFFTVDILDGDKKVASLTDVSQENGEAELPHGEVKFSLPQAELWNPDHPRLYTCRVSFSGDTAEESFGIRSLTWGENGLQINEERVIIQGACIHHDNGILGACCYPEAVERKVRLLMDTGYNAIRSAHNPCSKALLEVCDRLGMLVMDEYIDHWYIHKTQYDYVQYFNDWWRQDLKDMVEKDYNHPCVILYSTGNEVSETAQEKGIQLTRELTEYLHSLDDTRPVTCGVNISFPPSAWACIPTTKPKRRPKKLKRPKRRERSRRKRKKPWAASFSTTWRACWAMNS